MIKLLILSAIGFAIGLFIVKLLSRHQDDNVIDGEVVDVEKAKPRSPGFLPILLLGAVLVGIVLFVLPRFGISVMGVLQKSDGSPAFDQGLFTFLIN